MNVALYSQIALPEIGTKNGGSMASKTVHRSQPPLVNGLTLLAGLLNPVSFLLPKTLLPRPFPTPKSPSPTHVLP
jgi:hypothetical protein